MVALGLKTAVGAVMAFIMVIVLVPLLKRPARHIDLVDRPGGRKVHSSTVPLIGGLAMFIGFCAALAMVEASLRPYASLLIGMGLMLATGLVDDMIDIRPGAKLFCQVLASVLMVSWGEVQVHNLGSVFGFAPLELGEWSIPFTVLCTLILINAINMADGTDGLAGGLVAVALAMLLVIAILGGAGRAYIGVTGILLAAVIGFLCYNLRIPGRPHASVFMGDSGSLMLGFALAWLAIYLSQMEGVSVYPVTIAWILLLPVLDLVTLYVRRVMKGRSPFSADREHLHHVLLRSGFSVTATVWLLIAIMVLFGVLGIQAWRQQWPEPWMFLGLVPVFLTHYLFSARAWRLMRLIREKKDSE
jgi:UDP-GlcNAc:undecaprenyl-phosphate/decaprenyl-phosphate GlcNAc-1-phosphate transferase